MSFQVSFAPRIKGDWARLRKEVLDASQSESVLEAYESRIREACLSLGEFPNRYPAWRYDKSVRMMTAEKYLVFYRVVEKTVRIVHIRYAGRATYGNR